MAVAKAAGPEYQRLHDSFAELGSVRLGPMSSFLFRSDPRRISIVFARYKFCSKMLAHKKSALEIGCSDGTYSPVVMQTVGKVHGVDYDAEFIACAQRYAEQESLNVTYSVCDVIKQKPPGQYEGAFSLDVIEHIPREQESAFLGNIASVLTDDGICIMGTPNITSDPYASHKENGHVNLKSAETLHESMSAFFKNVFIFCMNDEMVHTGFTPMAHYLFGMGVGLKR